MRIAFPTIIFLLISSLFFECANPSSPTGGPKDTIPPNLVEEFPPYGTINMKEKEFRLVFDEYVNSDKVKSNLLITPTYEGKYSVQAKKNEVLIKFEEEFEDSTTYTLNFFEGITDITEKNPAENLTYVFSTGSYLDSLEISGYVQDLLTKEYQEDILIGLYQFTDTLDVSEDKPKYFTKSNEEGFFKLRNIKNGIYKIYSFKDENRNLLIDFDQEIYGFKQDTFRLNSSLDSVTIQLVKIDASPLEMISARPFSNYFDIRYSKEIRNYNINLLQPNESKLYHMRTNENKNLRIFNSLALLPEDSIGIIVSVYDTLHQSLTDTLYIKFNEPSPKKSAFDVNNISPKPFVFGNSIKLHLTYTKPIQKIFTSDSIYFKYDSLYQEPIDSFYIEYNYSETQTDFSFPINWKRKEDTIKSIMQSIHVDSTDIVNFKLKSISLVLGETTLISIENDTLAQKVYTPIRYNSEDFGVITIKLQTDESSFILELLDQKMKPLKQVRNKKQYTFTALEKGQYNFRILLDTNGDGKWSAGNILENKEPEPVILYNSPTDVRPNFEITLEDFSF